MKIRKFYFEENVLIIKSRKHAIILELENNNTELTFEYKFSNELLSEFASLIRAIANESWDNIKPKDADSFGSDYNEYYDRKLDNNGYLTINKNSFIIERPSLASNKLYQFNKRKVESFLYDLNKRIRGGF